MRSKWDEESAEVMVREFQHSGISEDMALRVYSCRLLGQDPSLVLHGGGNVSVKTYTNDGLTEDVKAICVKGSGWDMGSIEPPGLPSMYLEKLLELKNLRSLSDEDMVAYQRRSLIDPSSPNPSIETLVHSFLPHTFIDHTHATAVLSLTNQRKGKQLVSSIYNNRVGVVPYVKPGFDLALKASEIYELNPDVEGLILLNHGIFSFGSTAKESYDRMIDLVDLAEKYISDAGRAQIFVPANIPNKMAHSSDVLPIVRGLLAQVDNDASKTVILDYRSTDSILNFVNGAEVERYSQMGVHMHEQVGK